MNDPQLPPYDPGSVAFGPEHGPSQDAPPWAVMLPGVARHPTAAGQQQPDDLHTEEAPALQPLDRVWIWGLPLARLTTEQTLDEVDRLIQRRQPSLFVTANVQYAMLSDCDARLRAVNDRAAFLVADGMPLVWYSRLIGQPLPERVTGADLVYRLAERAACRGYRLFLLGGAPGVAEAAGAELARRYPGLQVAGAEAPMLDQLSPEEQAALVRRIRRARPDLLMVAFGQPKGELWLAENLAALEVPVSVQLGASLDFVTGRLRRAPRWLQRSGLEWAYRLASEPRRLGPRYLRNAWFLLKAVVRDIFCRAHRAAAPTDPA